MSEIYKNKVTISFILLISSILISLFVVLTLTPGNFDMFITIDIFLLIVTIVMIGIATHILELPDEIEEVNK